MMTMEYRLTALTLYLVLSPLLAVLLSGAFQLLRQFIMGLMDASPKPRRISPSDALLPLRELLVDLKGEDRESREDGGPANEEREIFAETCSLIFTAAGGAVFFAGGSFFAVLLLLLSGICFQQLGSWREEEIKTVGCQGDKGRARLAAAYRFVWLFFFAVGTQAVCGSGNAAAVVSWDGRAVWILPGIFLCGAFLTLRVSSRRDAGFVSRDKKKQKALGTIASWYAQGILYACLFCLIWKNTVESGLAAGAVCLLLLFARAGLCLLEEWLRHNKRELCSRYEVYMDRTAVLLLAASGVNLLILNFAGY